MKQTVLINRAVTIVISVLLYTLQRMTKIKWHSIILLNITSILFQIRFCEIVCLFRIFLLQLHFHTFNIVTSSNGYIFMQTTRVEWSWVQLIWVEIRFFWRSVYHRSLEKKMYEVIWQFYELFFNFFILHVLNEYKSA